ncbi:hypothetical protein BDP27DRAFT_1228406, partial [Rhodocollybia butyracea]
TAETMADFVAKLTELQYYILAGEASEIVNHLCQCGSGLYCNVKCHDCFQYEATWWYLKADISYLDNNQYTIQLPCSRGSLCKEPTNPNIVTLVDMNGFHGTQISYCGCNGDPDRVQQLMNARLFPGSVRFPRTLMTFRVLDDYTKQNLASKKSSYDYIRALRSLSDGFFTQEVLDPHPQFLLATRWERTPPELKHLNQDAKTMDGNFHLGQYIKNTDPNDISLLTDKDIGYFPDEKKVEEYLKNTMDDKEKSTCNYLNIVNNQNKKKFKNMRYSGVVNVSCNHCVIRSSMNLQKGEGFRFSDYALQHAFSQTRHSCPHGHLGASDFLFSYDCNCQYCVNLPKRFNINWHHMVDLISLLRPMIPALHIEDHKKRCKYEFNAAYIPGAAHKHGKSVEQQWVELNQLGGSVRQMNAGHRMEVLSDHYSYNNFRKNVEMPQLFLRLYKDALVLSRRKHRAFISVCISFRERIPGWERKAEAAKRYRNGIIEGIYEHQSPGNCLPFCYEFHLELFCFSTF